MNARNAQAAPDGSESGAADRPGVEEIVVTAQKRAESLQSVPDADCHTKGKNRDSQLYTAKLLMDRDGPRRFLLSADFACKDDRESVSEANLFPGLPEQIGAALGCVADGFYTYCNDGFDYLHTKAYGSTARLDYDAELFTVSSSVALLFLSTAMN